MAAIASAKLAEYRFRLEINGFDAAYIQSFDPGDRKHSVIKYFGAGMNHPFKEVGGIEFEDAVLTYVVPIIGVGLTYFEEWLNLGQNPATGNGGDVSDYMKSFTMYELNNGRNPVAAYEYFFAFPMHDKPGKRDAAVLDKAVIPEIHIAYAWRERRRI